MVRDMLSLLIDKRTLRIEDISMKQCSRCKQVKPLAEFHKDSGRRDGYAGRCKTCAIEIARAHYAKGQEYHQKEAKEYREKNKDKVRKWRKDYLARHPDRVHAYAKVQWARVIGEIPPASEFACESCGKPAGDYHHPDYSKPLELVPLCKS